MSDIHDDLKRLSESLKRLPTRADLASDFITVMVVADVILIAADVVIFWFVGHRP